MSGQDKTCSECGASPLGTTNPPLETKPAPLDSLFSVLVDRLACTELPCRKGPTTSCLNELHGKFIEKGPDKGKLKLYYASDCKAALTDLCPSCLAYWHVAVARNIVMVEQRFDAVMKREREREQVNKLVVDGGPTKPG